MGIRYRPGSTSRSAGIDGDCGDESGLAAIAQYGVGQRDPLTGTYESYDFPDGHPATLTEAEGATPVSWDTLRDKWPLIVADFSSEYTIRLAETRMPWPEFWWHLTGLLATDTRINRHLTKARG